ncbi:nitronate monooxygenase [Rothia sp. LK2588]|uniref:nitronate monooxygenase n=1 Tax=Rothia sp. LK2588 TaxID=3114369 RepID=UPI0034CF9A9A
MSVITSTHPIVAAPMAGGPSSVELARAVAQAGGFPFLAAGYKTVEQLAEQVRAARSFGVDFGVNLFVPASANDAPTSQEPFDRSAFEAFADRIAPEAAALGVELPREPRTDDDLYTEKLAYLRRNPVPVVSFTFGLSSAQVIAHLQQVGTRVLVTVTTAAEAAAAEANGADGLVVQGPRAGGHSATFDPTRTFGDRPTVEVLHDILEITQIPAVAAGGVDSPATARQLLDAGAEAVALGTALLRTDEAGTSPTHRAALADPRFTETVLTSAFTGRPARALKNEYLQRHHDHAILAYPQVHHLTKQLRAAAGQAGDAERLHLWAGTGWRAARAGSARDVIAEFAAQLG